MRHTAARTTAPTSSLQHQMTLPGGQGALETRKQQPEGGGSKPPMRTVEGPFGVEQFSSQEQALHAAHRCTEGPAGGRLCARLADLGSSQNEVRSGGMHRDKPQQDEQVRPLGGRCTADNHLVVRDEQRLKFEGSDHGAEDEPTRRGSRRGSGRRSPRTASSRRAMPIPCRAGRAGPRSGRPRLLHASRQDLR